MIILSAIALTIVFIFATVVVIKVSKDGSDTNIPIYVTGIIFVILFGVIILAGYGVFHYWVLIIEQYAILYR